MKLAIPALLAVLPFSALSGEKVDYAVSGGSYEGYRAPAEGMSKGLVLLIHDWDGLTAYEERRADMLAAMGYDAFAVDLYGKGNRPKEIRKKMSEVASLYQDRGKMRSLILGGLDEARKSSGGATVVMGYCFGGAAALELARSGEARDVHGYASFHGRLRTPEGQSYGADTPPLLIAHGGADESIRMDEVADLAKELEAAGVTYDIEVYSGAPHAFTVFGSDRYREKADKKSWTAFTNFLAENLGR